MPVSVVESSAGDTMEGFRNFGYAKLAADSAAKNVSLVDLNAEGKYQVIPLIDYDLHLQPVRLAARLLDPDAYRHLRVHAEDAQHRGGDALRQEHGAGRSAAPGAEGNAAVE